MLETNNADNKKVENTSVLQIFNTMEYSEVTENIDLAISWLKDKKHIFAYIKNGKENPNGTATEIKNIKGENEILCNIHTPNNAVINAILNEVQTKKWLEISPIKRTELIYKLGEEIEKNIELFCQLEIIVRGILSKDSKYKAIPLLVDYLKYYSALAVTYHVENPTWKPQGLSLGIVSDNNSLGILGCYLGPALAAGYNIVIQAGPKISPAIALIIDIAVKVGIPEGAIRLIPGIVDIQPFFTNNNVSVVSIFDDLYQEKYNITNPMKKKLITWSSSKIPIIVCEDADLDSVCQCAVDAIWGYQGLLPWSVDNILIQENIYEVFVTKLKNKIKKVNISNANNKLADISYPSVTSNATEILKKIIDLEKNRGIEIFQSNENSQNFSPILLIGAAPIFNNPNEEREARSVPIVRLNAFRTIGEAVLLANNNKQGIAASVWTENINVANEIVKKLQVSNVWINSHGLFAAYIPISPYKTSGNSFFGGKEGFYEYVEFGTLTKEKVSNSGSETTFIKTVNEAKKAQISWANLSRFARIQSIYKLTQAINNEKKNLSSKGVTENWIDDWLRIIYKCTLEPTIGRNDSSNVNYNINTYVEPCGVVIIETDENLEKHNKDLIMSSLIEGNVVIILNESKISQPFYTFVKENLPKSVFNGLSYCGNMVDAAALHNELNVYFGSKANDSFTSVSLKDIKKYNILNSRSNKNKILFVKNVWSNVSQSFT